MQSSNGYSTQQRSKSLRAFGPEQRAGLSGPCAICADPEAPGWHSEDYSEPFLFAPPAGYPMCNACHQRLHNRFQHSASEWSIFLCHVQSGGYGREFVGRFPLAIRNEPVPVAPLPQIRPRVLPVEAWWETLTLDPQSLEAPWARPRPLRARPSADAFRRALEAIRPNDAQWALLCAHMAAPNRAATMRELASVVWSKPDFGSANLRYGLLCKAIVRQTGWSPDRRKNGSSVWMTVAAEGWQPQGREYEWVMVGTLAEAVDPL